MVLSILIENVDMNMLQEQYNLLQTIYNEGDNDLGAAQNKALEGLSNFFDQIFIDNLDVYPQAGLPWECEVCHTTIEGVHLETCTSDMK